MEGYGAIHCVVQLVCGLVKVLLTNLARVLDPRCHLYSLPAAINNSHVLEGRRTVVVMKLKLEHYIVFPWRGSLFSLNGHTVDIVVLYSPRGKGPTRLQFTPMTSIPLLDTLTRLYAARPFKGRCWSAGGALSRMVYANVSSSLRAQSGIC